MPIAEHRGDIQPRVVRVLKNGRDYNGHFYQAAGKLEVCSAYGCETARLSRKGVEPDEALTIAKRLMKRIVERQSRF